MNTYNIETRHYDSYNGGGCRVYQWNRLVKGCTAGGCGYDRDTTALANFLMTLDEVKERITHKTANYGSGDNTGFYSLRHYNNNTKKWTKRVGKNTSSYFDGGCGYSSVVRLMKACKVTIERVGSSKNSYFYKIEVK